MSETICPDCGERNARGTEFCSACGGFLAWDGQQDDAPEPPAARPASPAAAVAPPPSPQQRSGPPAPGAVAPPARPPTGQSWRPTQQVAGAAEQIASRPAAQAWNAAAPALGAPLPGGFSAASIAQGVSGLGAQGLGIQGVVPGAGVAGASAAAAGWQGAGWGSAGQGQPPPGGPPQGPPAYQAPPEPPPPTEGPCPRCGVINGATLRFCGKCGLALKGPTLHDGGGARPQPPPERVPWWRRVFRPGGDNTRRAARAAYRHSLPVRVRAIRWAVALLGVGAIIGTLTLIGQNPVGWAVNNWNDLVGKTTQVQGLDAFTEPPPGTGTAPATAAQNTTAPNTAVPNTTAAPASGSAAAPTADTAGNVVDNLSDTAWTTEWSGAMNQQPAAVSCDSPPPAGASSILLVPAGSVTLKKISVAAGLPDSDSRRMLQWRPKTVQLSYSNGSCQQIVLDDLPDLQEKELDTVDTSQVLLTVIDAYPPATDQPDDSLSVTELRLFQRG